MAEDTQQSIKPDEQEQLTELTTKIINTVNLGMGASSMMVIKELKRMLENQEIEKYADRGVIVYISAAGALAYAGRDVYADSISSLVKAVGIDPDPDMLEAVRYLHLRNHLVYINAYNFLDFVGKEPTIDSVIDVIAALGVSPDATIAGYVIEFMNEYKSLRYTTIDTGPALKGKTLELFKKLSSGNMELCNLISELVIKESERILNNKEVRANLNQEMLNHLDACESLAFTARDVDAENITKVLAAGGITAREDYLEIIAKLKLRNQIIYVIALYFLTIAEIEPSVEYLINIVKAMDFQPDAIIANYVIGIYKVKKLAGGFKWLKL